METVVYTILSIDLTNTSEAFPLGTINTVELSFSTLGRSIQFFSSLHEMTTVDHVIVWIDLESRISAHVHRITPSGCIILVQDLDTLSQRRIDLRSFALVLGDSRL